MRRQIRRDVSSNRAPTRDTELVILTDVHFIDCSSRLFWSLISVCDALFELRSLGSFRKTRNSFAERPEHSGRLVVHDFRSDHLGISRKLVRKLRGNYPGPRGNSYWKRKLPEGEGSCRKVEFGSCTGSRKLRARGIKAEVFHHFSTLCLCLKLSRGQTSGLHLNI